MLDEARSAGDSLGAIIECVATGVPAGWGAPIYAKLDAELAAACMGINAVKGVEIGEGFAAGRRAAARAWMPSWQAGSTAASRPASRSSSASPSSRPRASARQGRHDPCVGIRGAPVVEAMVALVLADHKLLHRGQCG